VDRGTHLGLLGDASVGMDCIGEQDDPETE
jgi:hypothetical protein